MPNQTNPWEELLLLKVGMVAAAVAITTVFSLSTWHLVVDYLVVHHVLAAATEDPLVKLPGAGGAGIDARRLIGALAILALVGVAGASELRKWWAGRPS